MDSAVQTFEPTPEPSPRPSANAPQLRTLLLTDLVDSTGLVERMGDAPASDLFRAHDRLVLRLQQQWRGRLIDRSDGMLLLFERPIDGLGFALDYTRGLIALGEEHGIELRARIGLHVGEVLTWRNSEEAVSVGAKPVEVEGLAKPMAARLMATARPGQILLSAVAEPLAHRAARELGERGQHLAWKPWGRWRFKGVPESQYIFEVGEPDIAPLRMPPDTPKAWRDIPLWRRPAALAAEAALVAGLALGVWFIARPEPAIAFNQRDWVVIGDLRNLTGQATLDDSLEQAFRISLEQSRHVNVLSDIKARDTLARMQRAPDTKLDRAIASEIALRDGARAVILPTVAEVGGRVRVSAEVIDPRTQTTVYTETAEGTGVASTLDSIDTVTASLRGKLGEAVKSIEKDSVPLPQVTTKNLDALRAYALGAQAYGKRQWREAIEYFQRAVQLDPQFALAHLGLMRVYKSNVDATQANHHLERAIALRDRLAPREQLYLDAWAAEFTSQPAKAARGKWKLLADLYPDFYAGHYQHAWKAFIGNDFAGAKPYAKTATAPQEPLRSVAYELLARIELAQGKPDDALSGFRKAGAIGQYDASRRVATALATMRRFDEAEALLGKLKSSGIASGDLVNHLERIAVPLDRGRCPEARAAAATAASEAKASTALLSTQFRLIELLVGSVCSGKADVPGFRTVMDTALRHAREAESSERGELVFVALSAAYALQRWGGAIDEAAMQSLANAANGSGDPNTAKLLGIVEAQSLRLAGKGDAAITKLKSLVDGKELFQTRVALRDALRAAGREAEALREDRWLASKRGLAYIEAAGNMTLQALNVADTRVAKLPVSAAAASPGGGLRQ